MGWEEVERETEVGEGEDGEGFDEDVCYGFVFGEVGVELVAMVLDLYISYKFQWKSGKISKFDVSCLSDRANNKLHEMEEFILQEFR